MKFAAWTHPKTGERRVYINGGRPTRVWHGITDAELLLRCAQATPDEAAAMSTAAALMVHGECTEEEWCAAMRALHAVETRLIAEWEARHGKPRLNRFGRPYGGQHPALLSVCRTAASATSPAWS